MIVEVEDLLCLTNINFRSKGGGANNRLHKVDMAGLAQFWTTFMLDNIPHNSYKLDIPMKRAQLLYAILKGLSTDIGQTLS